VVVAAASTTLTLQLVYSIVILYGSLFINSGGAGLLPARCIILTASVTVSAHECHPVAEPMCCI
jgi:hypothetical protein